MLISDGAPDLQSDREFGSVSIGRGSYWANDVGFHTYTDVERILIGRYCSIADGASIIAGAQHDLRHVSTWPFDNILLGRENPTRTYRTIGDTEIGSDVWIGMRALICGGARIGHGAAIGAGAVVRGVVPPYAIVIGNPAQIIRYRFSEAHIAQLLEIAWWDWPAERIAAEIENLYAPVDDFAGRFSPAA